MASHNKDSWLQGDKSMYKFSHSNQAKRFKAERLNNFHHRASTSGFSYLWKRKWIRVSCYSILFCRSCLLTIIIGLKRQLQLTFAFLKGVYYEYGTRSEIICVQTGEDNGVTNALTVLCHGVGRKLKDVVIFTPR